MPQTQPIIISPPTKPPKGKARRSTLRELDQFVTEPDLELADEIAEEAGRNTNALWHAGVILAVLALVGRRRPGQSTLRWDATRFKYMTRDGSVVAVSAVRASIEAINKVVAERLVRLGEQLRAGRLTIGAFQRAARNELMAGHLLAGALANGGRAQLSDSVIEAIAVRVRQEFIFFDRLAREVEARTLPVAGRFFSRLKMYARAVRPTFHAVEREARKVGGFSEEHTILQPAEHCVECIEQAGRGWVSIGSLVPIGERTCRSGCRCVALYR